MQEAVYAYVRWGATAKVQDLEARHAALLGSQGTGGDAGLLESQNVERDFFGYERVQEIIRQGCIEDLPSKQLVDRLLGEVRDFAGDVPQQDDQTVVVVKIL